MYSQITANKQKTWALITIFLVVILALGYMFGADSGNWYGPLTIAGVGAIVMALTGYYAGDKIALGLAGAYPISKTDNSYVWNLVENLCISQGLPMPKVYLIPDQAMNAFATGRDPQHSSIALTQGLVAKLANEELEGVIAHELSHIKNLDIRLGTLVIVLVGMIVILSDIFLRSQLFFGAGRRFGNQNNGSGVIMMVGLILAILSPLIANLIKLAISRKREYLADAAGALATRYPEGLARALEKIAADGQPLQRASQATAHLYISSPFGAGAKRMTKLLSTHPPLAERVKALRQMA